MCAEAVPDEAASGVVAPAHILVVDDNATNRDVLTRRLKRQEYSVETASDGLQAMEKIRAQNFDLVLLDIMMPGLDGYEVLRQIKADAQWKRIPVIMISALGELDSVVRCIEMGAEDYLPKPFSPTLLKARVHSCLEKKHAADREAQLFSQLQENYARLRKLEQQRDELAHMIVHDLRSPLSANLAGIEMVEMLGPLTKEQRDCLQIATRSGQSLLGLINDLLDISKMESGALQLDLTTVDARVASAMAIEQVTPLLNDKNLQLEIDFPPDLPFIRADETKLQRVFVNLLANAVKFTPRGGKISIVAKCTTAKRATSGCENAARKKEDVTFSICDTGEGISPAAAGVIFEKFGQAQDRKAGRQNSTGLGLTFCKLAVEAHGGTIWVESTPGSGSVFSFTIPTCTAGACAAGTSAAGTSEAQS
jgi:signal transduction histidine kinase